MLKEKNIGSTVNIYKKKHSGNKHRDLKALDTFGNSQRPVFSLGVTPT